MKHQVFRLILKSQPRNQGFAMVFALVIGLIMSLVATTLLIQSSFYARQTTVDQQIQQNKFNAQNGLTELLNFLNRGNNRILASVSSETWGSALRVPHLYGDFVRYLQVCDSGQVWEDRKAEITKFADGLEIPLPQSQGNIQLEHFEVIDENRAQAIIKGSNQGSSTLKVELAITQSHYFQGHAPTLWLKSQTQSTQNNRVQGQFWANNCSFNLSSVRAIDPLKSEHTAVNFPSLPDLNEVEFRLPNSQKNLTLTNTTSASNLLFPRTGDQPTLIHNGRKAYEYTFNQINLSTSQKIEANSFVNGEQVSLIFYFKNGLPKTHISHICATTNCPSENFIMLGYGSSQICLQFDKLEGFVLAPDAEVGIVGRTLNNPSFTTSTWVDKMIRSGTCTTNQVRFFQGVQWQNLPWDFWVKNPYPKLSKVLSYQLIENNQVTTDSSSPLEDLDPPVPPGNMVPLSIDSDLAN